MIKVFISSLWNGETQNPNNYMFAGVDLVINVIHAPWAVAGPTDQAQPGLPGRLQRWAVVSNLPP